MNNKKWFTSLAVALILIITGCNALYTPPTAGDIPPQIVAWANTNVWKVEKGFGGHGSAFFIDNNTLVTACHVVDDIDEGLVGNADKTQVIAFNVLSCNEETDVAILERDFGVENDFRTRSTKISYDIPEEGTRVWGAGYPLWWDLEIVTGYFGKAIYHPTTYERRYTNSVPTIFGDSGSPLLSLHRGRVRVEGVRVLIAAYSSGFRSSAYVLHMAMATSGRDILNELNKDK